ncbi:GNAT family N-acetyltransferase [Geodermatophilus sp. DSM 45219]|uniref:GNAT family N-acetyltransferase n=1 Tax=Geodermatophilus sp. DSM 45219 TaxID=1881103 RepID=UPI000AD14521|nr:GNAT family protein [Geodermatophilus sp. DSM 45219]
MIVEDGRLVGQVTVADVARGPLQSGTLGYRVAGHATRRSVATAAAAAMVRTAFDEAGLHRLEAGTLPHDTASQRVPARTGSQRFGYAPRYLRIAGERRDHVLFQLLDEPGMR